MSCCFSDSSSSLFQICPVSFCSELLTTLSCSSATCSAPTDTVACCASALIEAGSDPPAAGDVLCVALAGFACFGVSLALFTTLSASAYSPSAFVSSWKFSKLDFDIFRSLNFVRSTCDSFCRFPTRTEAMAGRLFARCSMVLLTFRSLNPSSLTVDSADSLSRSVILEMESSASRRFSNCLLLNFAPSRLYSRLRILSTESRLSILTLASARIDSTSRTILASIFCTLPSASPPALTISSSTSNTLCSCPGWIASSRCFAPSLTSLAATIVCLRSSANAAFVLVFSFVKT